MKKVTVTINGNEKQLTVRPPSKVNRAQFIALLCQQHGIKKGDTVNFSSTMFFELSEEELKDHLKAATDISFADKKALKLDEEDNLNAALNAVTGFFSQLEQTTS